MDMKNCIRMNRIVLIRTGLFIILSLVLNHVREIGLTTGRVLGIGLMIPTMTGLDDIIVGREVNA